MNAGTASEEQTKWARVNWLGGAEYHNLTLACAAINDAFGHGSTFLVGSCLRARDYRDVDVRVILDDEHFDRLFPGVDGRPDLHGLWSLTCASISEWLRARTGLPVDFQIQRMTDANEQFPSRACPRNAIGLFLHPDIRMPKYPGGR